MDNFNAIINLFKFYAIINPNVFFIFNILKGGLRHVLQYYIFNIISNFLPGQLPQFILPKVVITKFKPIFPPGIAPQAF